MRLLLNIAIFCLILCQLPLNAQDFVSLPKLLPAYSEDFSDYSSFPSLCFEKAFEDINGKLWLVPCGVLRNIDGIHLFQFDGYDFKFVKGDWEQFTDKSRFAGIYKERALVGLRRNNNETQLFFYDLQTDSLRFNAFETVGKIRFISLMENDRLFLVAEKEEAWVFYEWAEEELVEQGQFRIPDMIKNKGQIFQNEVLLLNEEEFWVKKFEANHIWRINKKTASAKKIDATDFSDNLGFADTSLTLGNPIGREVKAGAAFYLYRDIQQSRILYQFNPVNHRFEQVEDIPDNWDIQNIVADQQDNQLFLFKNQQGDYRSILQDTYGNRFDYSALFADLNGVPVYHFQSTNFKEQIIICHNRGLLLQRVKAPEAIQYFMPDMAIRAMSELPNGQFLIGTQGDGIYLLDRQAGNAAPLVVPGCPFQGTGLRSTLISDADGNIWTHYYGEFIKYQPITNTCDHFKWNNDDPISSFIFMGKDRLAVIDNQQFLYSYDLVSQEATPFLVSGKHQSFSGKIHDMLYGKNGRLWVATSDGLWKLNLTNGTVEEFGKSAVFQDSRFLCIDQDDTGQLWLGTTLGGLHIYNPNSGEVKILNNEQGLANNTVVSILVDEDGDRWLATYNGVSIVNKDGGLKANISLEDGLVEKENNRFAHLKAMDGKLLFGTINGLHIIDPQKIKDRLNEPQRLKVYLTALEYHNQKKKILQTYRLNEVKALELPASKRYLNLDFALSNYFKPAENQYAYMLKGLDDDWTYLGQQRSLNLNNLPAGRYELLIKGGDAIGNWTQEPLAISIYAKEYFYKKTWFFLVLLLSLLLLVSGIAWLWIRRLRSEVKKATHKIRKDKEVIERQAAQLMDIDKAKSIFFTNISHEFRTPLTVISGMVGRLKKHPEERLEHSYDMIQRNSDNLLNLVNQILDLRKLESGKLEVDLIQADVIPYLRYIFESFELLARNKDIQAHLLLEVKELVMDYDKKKLLRIVSNLLSNAIKFTPEGGNIYLMVNTSNTDTLGVFKTPRVSVLEVLTIKVKDTGIGISPKKLPHIFDRFYQVDGSSTRVGEGTGIGLALCKELITLLGGEIQVESEMEKGTEFVVSLPITNEAPLSEQANQEILLVSQTGITNPYQASTSRPIEMASPNEDLPLILLIEDNADVVQYLITCLEDQHNLVIARDGEEGIEKALESIPDAIVSDVMMPRKDGFEVCYTLKNDERTSHIPIILLTAKADVASRLSGLRRGADDYLTKPFNEEELLTRLENQMEIRRKLQLYFQNAQPLPPALAKEVQQEDEFLHKIRLLLEEHIDEEDYGILQICRAIGLSRTQLHRKIKALTGKSTSLYLRQIRLSKAKELLETSDMNVSEVAYAVGFKDPSYFSRLYAEAFGSRPKETRK